jgi:hypothetical protein
LNPEEVKRLARGPDSAAAATAVPDPTFITKIEGHIATYKVEKLDTLLLEQALERYKKGELSVKDDIDRISKELDDKAAAGTTVNRRRNSTRRNIRNDRKGRRSGSRKSRQSRS